MVGSITRNSEVGGDQKDLIPNISKISDGMRPQGPEVTAMTIRCLNSIFNLLARCEKSEGRTYQTFRVRQFNNYSSGKVFALVLVFLVASH